MKVNYKGYLLLESMIAMAVIVTSILFMFSTMVFMLKEEKKSQDELEMAILLFEMASATKQDQVNQPDILNKSENMGVQIIEWQNDQLRIEREELSLEIIKE